MKHEPKEQQKKIIGRFHEQEILRQFLKSEKAEFLALYGRRRVGKTYLIRNFFEETSCIFFHATGIQGGNPKKQIEQFYKQIGMTFYGGASIQSRQRWLDAFEDLTKATQQIARTKNIVIFLDEFPWMSTKRSGLLQALEYYWNRYWNHDTRIKLIICGSSASWIIEKIINNKGGLYNRVTRNMRLFPFTLYETKSFLASLDIYLNEQQILNLYMVLGGVPHYLALCRRGLSASQCIDEICFHKDAALIDEFERLFASLFQNSEIYIDLIRIIGRSRYGVSQAKIIHEKRASSGGRAIYRLKQLEEAGFILSFLPYGNQEKGKYFKIVDEYTLFYLHWIKPALASIRKLDHNSGYWLSKARSQSWKSWAGYAFEAVCHKHISQIQKALGIEAGADIGSWRYIPSTEDGEVGAQIDLLFDRPDEVITICEIKHSGQPFIIDKIYADVLIKKIEVYKQHTRTKKHIFLAMITNNGVKPSKQSGTLIAQCTTLEDLFRF